MVRDEVDERRVAFEFHNNTRLLFGVSGGMASDGGPDDIVDGSANGDSLAPVPRHSGECESKESEPIEGGGGGEGHFATAYSPAPGS